MLSIIKYKALQSPTESFIIHQTKGDKINRSFAGTRKSFFSNGISYHQTMLKHVALLSRSPSSREKIKKKKKHSSCTENNNKKK